MTTSESKPKRIKQTIDLTEFIYEIDRLAKTERRTRLAMVQTLLDEALAARRKRLNDDLIG